VVDKDSLTFTEGKNLGRFIFCKSFLVLTSNTKFAEKVKCCKGITNVIMSCKHFIYHIQGLKCSWLLLSHVE
jgi:hypothetical protein